MLSKTSFRSSWLPVGLLLVSVLLSGCSDSHIKADPQVGVLPEELKDCTFHHVRIDMTNYRVVKCPGANTVTNTYGKNGSGVTVTINGKKYVEVPEGQKEK